VSRSPSCAPAPRGAWTRGVALRDACRGPGAWRRRGPHATERFVGSARLRGAGAGVERTLDPPSWERRVGCRGRRVRRGRGLRPALPCGRLSLEATAALTWRWALDAGGAPGRRRWTSVPTFRACLLLGPLGQVVGSLRTSTPEPRSGARMPPGRGAQKIEWRADASGRSIPPGAIYAPCA